MQEEKFYFQILTSSVAWAFLPTMNVVKDIFNGKQLFVGRNAHATQTLTTVPTYGTIESKKDIHAVSQSISFEFKTIC